MVSRIDIEAWASSVATGVIDKAEQFVLKLVWLLLFNAKILSCKFLAISSCLLSSSCFSTPWPEIPGKDFSKLFNVGVKDCAMIRGITRPRKNDQQKLSKSQQKLESVNDLGKTIDQKWVCAKQVNKDKGETQTTKGDSTKEQEVFGTSLLVKDMAKKKQRRKRGNKDQNKEIEPRVVEEMFTGFRSCGRGPWNKPKTPRVIFWCLLVASSPWNHHLLKPKLAHVLQ